MTANPSTRLPPDESPQLLTAFDGAPPAATLTGVHKSFAKKQALAGIDLRVPEGAVYVLVGPNGAGKTTALRALLDLTRPDAGEARVLGRPPSEPAARAGVGYVPEGRDGGYAALSVRRLLRHHARYFPAWEDGYAAELTRRLDIDPGARFGRLSKGEARRVQLVLALAHRPPLLLLDEPTDGLDPLVRDEVLGIVADHLAHSTTSVLLSTHRVHEVEGLADHLGVLRRGRLVAQLERSHLAGHLHRVRIEVPDGWAGAPALEPRVLRRAGRGRELVWTVWGEPRQVAEALAATGATVRAVDRLNLEEATLTLLAMEER